MSSWWRCCILCFCVYKDSTYFLWCEVLNVPVIIYYFVIVLFRIISRESAGIPASIVELFPDFGVIGVNGL